MIVVSLAAGLGFSIVAQRRAERRFNDVRSLANSFLFEVHDEISQLPGSVKARALVLRKGLEYLDQLAKDAAGDATLQMELASAYTRIGQLQGLRLADATSATLSLQKAQEIAQVVAQSAPTDEKRNLVLVDSLYALGQLESSQGKSQLARSHLNRGTELVEGLAEPDKPEILSRRIQGNSLLASLSRHEGNHTQAVREQRRAATLAAQWLRTSPAEETKYLDISVRSSLAVVLSETGDLEAANHILDEISPPGDALLARHPGNPLYAGFLRRLVWTRAVLAGDPRFVNGGDYARSLALFRTAEGLARRAFEEDKADVKAQADLLGLHLGQAIVLTQLSPKQGLAMLKDTISQFQTMRQKAGELLFTHYDLGASGYSSAGMAAARLRQWSSARKNLAEALVLEEILISKEPSFEHRLDRAGVLRQMASVDAASGNRALGEQRFRQALGEVDGMADGHRQEVQWVWKRSEILEGLGDLLKAGDRAKACDYYQQSLNEWMRWRSEGGADSVFFRTRRDRAARLSAGCATH